MTSLADEEDIEKFEKSLDDNDDDDGDMAKQLTVYFVGLDFRDVFEAYSEVQTLHSHIGFSVTSSSYALKRMCGYK